MKRQFEIFINTTEQDFETIYHVKIRPSGGSAFIGGTLARARIAPRTAQKYSYFIQSTYKGQLFPQRGLCRYICGLVRLACPRA